MRMQACRKCLRNESKWGITLAVAFPALPCSFQFATDEDNLQQYAADEDNLQRSSTKLDIPIQNPTHTQPLS
jgi:hypothetical protein